jgi:hypothetical protein
MVNRFLLTEVSPTGAGARRTNVPSAIRLTDSRPRLAAALVGMSQAAQVPEKPGVGGALRANRPEGSRAPQ